MGTDAGASDRSLSQHVPAALIIALTRALAPPAVICCIGRRRRRWRPWRWSWRSSLRTRHPPSHACRSCPRPSCPPPRPCRPAKAPCSPGDARRRCRCWQPLGRPARSCQPAAAPAPRPQPRLRRAEEPGERPGAVISRVSVQLNYADACARLARPRPVLPRRPPPRHASRSHCSVVTSVSRPVHAITVLMESSKVARHLDTLGSEATLFVEPGVALLAVQDDLVAARVPRRLREEHVWNRTPGLGARMVPRYASLRP